MCRAPPSRSCSGDLSCPGPLRNVLWALTLMETRGRKSETGVSDSRLFGGVRRNFALSTVAGAFEPCFSPYNSFIQPLCEGWPSSSAYTANFDARGRCLIGPLCSAWAWELSMRVTIGRAILYTQPCSSASQVISEALDLNRPFK